MSVALDSIAKGNADRKATVDAFFATKSRSSPLGVYDIDKDGDTTLTNYGSYRVKGGKLVFDKVIKAAA
jgi:branched-chain amino acid transport system substrate-binding protein